MIPRASIEERVREWGLREDIVEKDYVIGWVLSGIGSDPRLGTTWIFKGGTCLKKCWLETYRFSEDLDFTVSPGGPIYPADALEALRPVLARIGAESGIDFAAAPHSFRSRPGGRATEGRVYYRGPRATPSPASVKIDLTGDEPIVLPPVERPIGHSYEDAILASGLVRTYAIEELFAEKIRALGERGRPRDLYDVVSLFRRAELRMEAATVRSVLEAKCLAKGIPVPTSTRFESPPALAELEAEWENMLGHQLPALPPIGEFRKALPELFAWLETGARPAEPGPAPSTVGEVVGWAPSPVATVWGFRVPLETVRFAAVNRLCVELGYGGRTRLIEPYSLRRTRDGHLLLHAVKAGTREPRAYRVDRIQSARVTERPFTPVYAVELASAGPLRARETERSAPAAFRASSAPRLPGRLVYVVSCPSCGKRFRRSRYDTSLRPHRAPGGWSCPARFGHVADTRLG